MRKTFGRIRHRATLLWVDEAGMSTVEYAIGTIVIYTSFPTVC